MSEHYRGDRLLDVGPATFDQNDHTLTPGYATWASFCEGKRPWVWLCRVIGHNWTDWRPAYPGSRTCSTCLQREQFYSVGRHRYGSLDRWVWEAYVFDSIADRLRPPAAPNEEGAS